MASGHTSPVAVIVTKVVFTAIAAMLTAARLYTRTQIVRNAGIDDVFMVIGLASSIVLSATTWMQVHYGMGRHESSLNPELGPLAMFWLWAAILVYNFALGVVKLSILLQYLRILPKSVRDGPLDERRPRNGYRIATFIMVAVVSVFTTWTVLSGILTCVPVRKFWRATEPGTCLPRLTVWFVNAGVNIATDICTVAIPLPVLNSLQIPKRQRHILMFVFGAAGITVLIGILRLPFLYIYAASDDTTWDSPMINVTSSLEINIGIICSNVPTLKGLVSRFIPSIAMGDKYFGRTGRDRDPGSRELGGMDDLEDFRATGERCSSQNSVGTTAYLSTTSFNTTARLDERAVNNEVRTYVG